MDTLKSTPSLSFCLAAYNEEDNLAVPVEEAVAVGRAGSYDFEVLLCDDGSTDRTAVIVQELGLKHPEVQLIQHERNRGIIDVFETLEALIGGASGAWVFYHGAAKQGKSAEVLFSMRPMMCLQ